MLSSARLAIILAIVCVMVYPSDAKDKAYQAKRSSIIRPTNSYTPSNKKYEVTIKCDDGAYCAYPPK